MCISSLSGFTTMEAVAIPTLLARPNLLQGVYKALEMTAYCYGCYSSDLAFFPLNQNNRSRKNINATKKKLNIPMLNIFFFFKGRHLHT